jgi:hypothetical protein
VLTAFQWADICRKGRDQPGDLLVRAQKIEELLCRLYGSRCCLLSCVHTVTASLWPRDRGATPPVQCFAEAKNLTVIAEFVEAETGKAPMP